MNLSDFRSGRNGLFMRERRFFCNPNETYSWKVPAGVSEVFAFVIGGGGGGAHRNWSSDSDDPGGGCGGGGQRSNGHHGNKPFPSYSSPTLIPP